MAKIPFNIIYRPQIESGEYKVETWDGKPVRIICWDRQHQYYPLLVLMPGSVGEDCVSYTIDGRYYCGRETNDSDLFLITPEPELKESDDERTRKEIIEHLLPQKNELLVKKWIAYLEKQKEQKPAELSKEEKEDEK